MKVLAAQQEEQQRKPNTEEVPLVRNTFFEASVWSKEKARFCDVTRGKGKCGYCERERDEEGECQVDHFRPKTIVSRLQSALPDPLAKEPPDLDKKRECWGYWWLAYEWSNYVLVCPSCNSLWKRTLFPVKQRCGWSEGADLSNEEPLLFDPHDEREVGSNHFRWTVSGTIEAASPNDERAVWTIGICGLNRKALLADRLKAWCDARRAFDQYLVALQKETESAQSNRGIPAPHCTRVVDERERDIDALASEARPFAAMLRWCFKRWFEEHKLEHPFDWS